MDPQLAGRLGSLEEAHVGAIVAAETYKGDAEWEQFVDHGGRPWWWRERDGLCFYEPAGGAACTPARSVALEEQCGALGASILKPERSHFLTIGTSQQAHLQPRHRELARVTPKKGLVLPLLHLAASAQLFLDHAPSGTWIAALPGGPPAAPISWSPRHTILQSG